MAGSQVRAGAGSDPRVPKRMTKRWKALRSLGKRSPSRGGAGMGILAGSTCRTPDALKRGPDEGGAAKGLQVFRCSESVTGGVRQVSRRGTHAMRESFTRICRPELVFGPDRPAAWDIGPSELGDRTQRTKKSTIREGYRALRRVGMTALESRARTSYLSAEIGERRRSNEMHLPTSLGGSHEQDLAGGCKDRSSIRTETCVPRPSSRVSKRRNRFEVSHR